MPAWPAPTTTTPWPDVGCRFASPDAFILNRVPSHAVAKHPSFSPKLHQTGCTRRGRARTIAATFAPAEPTQGRRSRPPWPRCSSRESWGRAREPLAVLRERTCARHPQILKGGDRGGLVVVAGDRLPVDARHSRVGEMSSCDGVIVTVDFVPVPQLPRGIRPMLGGGAGAPQTCAGERSHSHVTRDLGRAASTEGVTAVPPQQPPPDAARVRIVLPYRTPCASRKARDSRREAGPDRTTRPSTARPCPWPRAG